MKTASVLVVALITTLAASGCSSVANEPSTQIRQANTPFDQNRTILLRAGQSLSLASNERIEAPSGVFATAPDKAGKDSGKMVVNGHGNTLSVPQDDVDPDQ